MKPWMMALGRARRLITQTFTANTTFVIPFGVSSLVTLSGKGAAGTPAGAPVSGWCRVSTTTYIRRDGGTDQTSSQSAPVFDGSTAPDDYCDPAKYYCDPNTDATCTIGSTVYSESTTCYSFSSATAPGDPATTGSSATGFGKTFAGGVGGPATTTTYSDVPVTGGASYSLVIPTGGSITFSYYQ